jgi:hypothetical protein
MVSCRRLAGGALICFAAIAAAAPPVKEGCALPTPRSCYSNCPRSRGLICPIHCRRLEEMTLPIEYRQTTFATGGREEEYDRMRSDAYAQLFPFAETGVEPHCSSMPSDPTTMTEVCCRDCIRAAANWLREHPRPH